MPAPRETPPETRHMPLAAWLSDASHGDAVRAAADTLGAPLCMRCLGRLTGRIGPGTDNLERGATLRDTLGMPVTEDDTACPLCEGIFRDVDFFAGIIDEATAPYGFDSFLLATRVHPQVLAKEARAHAELGASPDDIAEPMKTELNRTIGGVLAPRWGKRVDFKQPDLIATLDPYFAQVQVTSSAVYLYGRYRKFDRTIPQTRWPCNVCRGNGCTKCGHTGQQYRTSVEALIAHAAVAAFHAKDESFHGSGREDIDALMLGTGRPFVLELKEPRHRVPMDGGRAGAIDLAMLQERINAHARPRVEIDGLRASTREEVVAIKDAAYDKAYRAHIVAEGPVARERLEAAIAHITATPLEQRTPERVSHRRADLVRKRRVKRVTVLAFGTHERADVDATARDVDAGPMAQQHEGPAGAASTTALGATRFTLDILAESGTYIKELVHGDEGRTQPSFAGTIGVPMKVVALDVVGVGEL